jgi:hypothetical protein
MARWSRNRFLKNFRSRDGFDTPGAEAVGAEGVVCDCNVSEEGACAKALLLVIKTQARTRAAVRIQNPAYFILPPRFGVTFSG